MDQLRQEEQGQGGLVQGVQGQVQEQNQAHHHLTPGCMVTDTILQRLNMNQTLHTHPVASQESYHQKDRFTRILILDQT